MAAMVKHRQEAPAGGVPPGALCLRLGGWLKHCNPFLPLSYGIGQVWE